MSRHRFGSPGDHALLAGGGLALGLGLVASATVPGVEAFLNVAATAVVALLVVAAAGWAACQVIGENRAERELQRPPRPVPPGWETRLVRVDPDTGAPWQERAEDAQPAGGELR